LNANCNEDPGNAELCQKRPLEKLGWPTGQKVDVTLDVENGALIVKKKSGVAFLFFLYFRIRITRF
jgi:hypothetical protein